MENASKALMMAGAVLIAVLVISLLVIFFNNLRDLQGLEQGSEELEQIVEFNKQYEVYSRDVYGSELLSIANKIVDYNHKQAENKGYAEIELQVQISSDMDNTFFKKGSYTASKIKLEADTLKEKIEELGIEDIASKTNSKVSRTISQLATMRTSDIEQLGIQSGDYKIQLNQYNTYKTLLTQVKEKIFKFVNFEYDENNGRITKMIYR